MDELKDMERERGELLKQPRTTRRDDRLDFLSRSQRRIVELMAKIRRKGDDTASARENREDESGPRRQP